MHLLKTAPEKRWLPFPDFDKEIDMKDFKFLGGNFFNGPCFFNGLEVSFCLFCCIYVSIFFNKLNKEISLSSRSLLASRNSFSLN